MSNLAAFSAAGISGPGMGCLWGIHEVPTPTLPRNKLSWAAGQSGRRHPYFLGAPRSALNVLLGPNFKELCSEATAQKAGMCELQGGHLHPRERNPFHTGTRGTHIYLMKQTYVAFSAEASPCQAPPCTLPLMTNRPNQMFS